MFDFHTHILPRLDDGSRSIEESLRMLREMQKQGITGAAATPHFYPDRMSPRGFFETRRASFEALRPHLTSDMPMIRLGAEVRYFEGICHMERIPDFRIQGTDLLLVEMPNGRWTSRMIDSLLTLHHSGKATVLLAHVERYLAANPRATWDGLLENGVLMQVSADYFIPFFSRKKAASLMARDRLHLIGSDCHNMTVRKPNMKPAADYITEKMGKEFFLRYLTREKRLLNE